MKKFVLLCSIFINMPFLFVHAAENNELKKENNSYSIYLIHHAEKQLDKDDPALTQCGQYRARQLASILENAKIKKIFSTRYKRTMATATPLAQQ